ncbi:DnaJ C-terminal domain-containing protein [Legionella dresdenensis]|uniref:DnaJ C-terminal domain-containing protein n=1 Tax=Legionella dresdenensis TaxID=450200 RepID=A0ABV8CDK3_9GAMM
MEYKDYYKIMGLERNASQDDIKRTYRKLARKYHPDVSKEADAENKFKELGEAYEVLRDPEKRAKYDQFGQYWQQQGQQRPGQGQQQYHYQQGSGQSSADFEEFINSIFGQKRQQRQSHFYENFDQGQDVHASLDITLEDSFHGAEKTLQLQEPVVNPEGYVEYRQRTIKVKIPKGIADKQQFRLKGQGEKGGGKAGDLYIQVNILPHALFNLNNKDILLQVPVTPWEAALGTTIQAPTLGGKVNLKIPPLSQAGKQMRLKGRGLPGSPAGDQIITLQIVIPPESNEQLNHLYEQMAKTVTFNPREKLGVGHGK